jgi:hypothetical protein
MIMSTNAYKIAVTFPVSGKTFNFSSVRAVARMLSGNGKASGGLRKQIDNKALDGVWGLESKVRNNTLAG